MNTMHSLTATVSFVAWLLIAASSSLGQASAPAPQPAPATTSPTQSPTPHPAQPPMNHETAKAPGTDQSPDGAAPTAAVKTQVATFGAGCFWGVEETYRTFKGVVSTRVGYAGGKTEKPTYKEVCRGDTNHAEVVEVTFDPAKVSYQELVDLFFKLHDPTQVNRQGPDYGTQYRTVIFYHSPEQRTTAEATIKRLTDAGKYKRPIATKVEPAPTFWVAEDYHQQYFFTRGIPNTCHIAE